MAAGIIKALFGIGKGQMKTVPWTKMTPELHNQLSSQLGKLMFVVKSQNLKLSKFQQDYLMNQLKHMEEFEKRVLTKTETIKPKGEVHPFTGAGKLRVQQDVDGIIKNLKSMDSFDAIKEGRLIINRKGKYKNLSFDESQKILKETDRHMLGQNLDDLPNPEDFASGGIARVGMVGGGTAWKKFIEMLFIKSSNDIRQGKGLFKGLTEKQRIVQHDNLTKKIMEWQKTGKTVGLEEHFGVDTHTAFIAARDKVKRQGIIKDVPEVKTKKVDKDRKLTEEEWKDFVEDNSDDLNEELLTGDETLNDLENMVAEQKAYEADMYRQYKRGDLDKYVKPEVLEEQALRRQKKIDNVLDKAYDEVFYQKPVTGDYKLDADVLSDSIAEQLGKGSFTDLPQTHQTQIYNTALKRVTQDMKMKQTLKKVEEKMMLSDFDVKGRKPNASGGIAGQLHLNEGGRAGFPFGGPATGKKALKAIMDAFRSNKHWGVGGPPYDPGATSFDVKKITERVYGAPLSLTDIRKGAKHPRMSGINKFDFPAFNKKWKEVKANVLKQKLEESQRWAISQIKAAKKVPAEDATGKKVRAQFLRDGEKMLKEANEGLKEIEIYINMLQKKGRKLHASGGIAGQLNRPGYKGGLKVYPRLDITEIGKKGILGEDISERDITYGGTGIYQGPSWFAGAQGLTGNVKVDVTAGGETLFKDTMSKDDAINYIIGLGEAEGDKFQIKSDEDFNNLSISFTKKWGEGGKGRDEQAKGGRASYTKGGLAHVLGV